MKYVLTAKETAKFTGLSANTIRCLFRHDCEDIPHFWAKDELRVMAFPFLRFLEGKVNAETCQRLRDYMQM